jgi:hypothetical protein
MRRRARGNRKQTLELPFADEEQGKDVEPFEATTLVPLHAAPLRILLVTVLVSPLDSSLLIR